MNTLPKSREAIPVICTLSSVTGIIHGRPFFLPSELEDDLLGEDLLSGKKVRNMSIPETK